jgi:5-methylcytosine-specific restriction endonuclease McrA
MLAMRIACTLSAWVGEPGRCQWCNKDLSGQSRRKVWCSNECAKNFECNHIWGIARHRARRRAKYQCVRPNCTNDQTELEVNHIIPLVGIGYGPSCFHHEDNIEVLCKPHHQIETNRQREERKADKLLIAISDESITVMEIDTEDSAILGIVEVEIPEEDDASLLDELKEPVQRSGPKRPDLSIFIWDV